MGMYFLRLWHVLLLAGGGLVRLLCFCASSVLRTRCHCLLPRFCFPASRPSAGVCFSFSPCFCLCFSASLLFCFSAFLLLCFSAALLQRLALVLFGFAIDCFLLVLVCDALAFLHPNPRNSSITIVIILIVTITV